MIELGDIFKDIEHGNRYLIVAHEECTEEYLLRELGNTMGFININIKDYFGDDSCKIYKDETVYHLRSNEYELNREYKLVKKVENDVIKF